MQTVINERKNQYESGGAKVEQNGSPFALHFCPSSRSPWRVSYQFTSQSRKITKSFANKADADRFIGLVREQQGALYKALGGNVTLRTRVVSQDVLPGSDVRWLGAQESERMRGALQPLPAVKDEGITLEKAVEEFLAYKQGNGRSKRTIWSLSSELVRFVKHCKVEHLRQVTKEMCKAYIYKAGVSKRTQNHRWLRLNNLLAWAADPKRDYLDRNPCDLVDKPYVPMPDEMPCIITMEEADRVLAAAKEVGCLKIVALQLLAGLRPSEATEIRMEACQAEHIAVIGVGKLRNRCRRIVPVAPRLRELLPEMRKKAQQWPVTNKKKRAIEKKAGVKIGHDALRHTYVSMETALVGREMAAEYSGNSVEVIKRYYLNPQTAETAHRFFGESPRP